MDLLLGQLFGYAVDLFDGLTRVYMRIGGLLRPEREAVTIFGAKVRCNIRDFIQRRIYFFKIYEPNLTYLLLRDLNAGDVFVDIGANIGYFTLLASSRVGPQGKVIAIEAAPDTFKRLKNNLDLNRCQNVEAHNVAATSEHCLVEIVRVDPRNIGTNAIRIAGRGTHQAVTGRPLLEILGQEAARVRVIKIDVEGSEGPILDEITRSLERFPRRLTIFAEISSESIEYADRLRDAGFRIFALPNSYRIGYLLVRHFLARSAEEGFVVTIPLDACSNSFRDYVFERT